MDILELRKTYLISESEINRIIKNFFDEITNGKNPNLFYCNFILGQQASGKSTYSKSLCQKDDNLVNINGDKLREKHPHIRILRTAYPTEFINILTPDIILMKDKLLDLLVQHGYAFNLEFSLDSIDKVKKSINITSEYKYQINCIILAVSELICHVRVLERFINQIRNNEISRIVSVQRLEASYERVEELLNVINFELINSFTMIDMSGIEYPISKESNQKFLILDTYRKWNEYYANLINISKRIKDIKDYIEYYKDSIGDELLKRANDHLTRIEELSLKRPFIGDN